MVESVEKSVRKSADFLKRKSLVYHPTDFHVTPTDFFKKNRPTTTDFSIFVCLWKSVRKFVWWELGLKLHLTQNLPQTLSLCIPIPIYSTINIIPTTLRYSLLLPVCKEGRVKIEEEIGLLLQKKITY